MCENGGLVCWVSMQSHLKPCVFRLVYRNHDWGDVLYVHTKCLYPVWTHLFLYRASEIKERQREKERGMERMRERDGKDEPEQQALALSR